MSNHRSAVFLLLTLCMWRPITGAERSVSCLVSSDCLLPCGFAQGPEVVIHWLKPPEETERTVHSFYHGNDQLRLQWPRYKDRTRLFKDQISIGNASLKISGTTPEDAGRYKCYTSTITGNNEDFITVHVEAGVRFVSLSEEGGQLVCRSEDVFPEPTVSWTPHSEAVTTTTEEGGLWRVQSSVSVPLSTTLQYNCNVSNSRSSWRSATYRRNDPISASGPEITVSCSASDTNIKNLVWTFNKSQTILNQTGPDPVYDPAWKDRAKLGPGSDLVLKNLNQDHQGVYFCNLATEDQDYVTKTEVTVNPEKATGQVIVGVGVGVGLFLVLLLILAVFIYLKCFKNKKSQSPSETKANRSKDNKQTQQTELLMDTKSNGGHR